MSTKQTIPPFRSHDWRWSGVGEDRVLVRVSHPSPVPDDAGSASDIQSEEAA